MYQIINFIRNAINNIIDVTIYLYDYYFSLFICIIGIAMIVLLVTFSTKENVYTKNYIMYSGLEFTDKCGDLRCLVKTDKGEFTISKSTFDQLEGKKFDIGMMFGNCNNMLYFKVYTNDIIEPYIIIYDRVYDYDETEFSLYNKRYNVKPLSCK